MSQVDKAGSDYWDDNWTGVELPKLFSHTDTSLDNFVNLELHKYFKKLFGDRRGFSIAEIGCANSIWPLYFQQYFDAKCYGIDYSEVGCQKSRELLKHYNIPGEVYCADLFAPPAEIVDKFDYVVSFGVVEHFEDTANCLNACAKLLKPGGTLITMVPNIPSLNGLLQKWVDKEVYDVHVPLSKTRLSQAHVSAGLELSDCDYFMAINLSVVNSGKFTQNKFNKYFRKALSIPSKLLWSLQRIGISFPKTEFISPYIMACAIKN